MSRADSAIRAGGTQTSSMSSAAPCGRIAPTMPCMPSRTSQKISVSWRSRVNAAGSSSSQSASAASARCLEAVELGLVVGAQLDEQDRAVGRELAPGLRACPGSDYDAAISVGLTISSTAVAPASTSARHRLGGGVDGREEEQAGGGVAAVRDGVEHGLGDEAERALRADEQAAEDLAPARRRRGTRTAGSRSCS